MFNIKGLSSKIFGNNVGRQVAEDEDSESIAVDEYIEEDSYQRASAATGTDDNVISLNSYQSEASRYNPSYTSSYASGYSSPYSSQKTKAASKTLIEIYKPRDISDAAVICANVKKNIVAIVNLSEVSNETLRQRICDFLSGVACALDGVVEPIHGAVFAIVPKNAKIKVGDLVRKDY